MSLPALTLTQDGLAVLVAQHVADLLPAQRVEAIAERMIAGRIGQLTLEQAARHLQCKNERQLSDFCRAHKIPILHFGAKKRFVLLADIEAAQQRASLSLAENSSTGTAIVPTAATHRKAA